MNRVNNLKEAQELVSRTKIAVVALENLLHEQFESDTEHLKLYVSEAGTLRLDAIAEAARLCDTLTIKLDKTNNWISKAVEFGGKLEVKTLEGY